MDALLGWGKVFRRGYYRVAEVQGRKDSEGG